MKSTPISTAQTHTHFLATPISLKPQHSMPVKPHLIAKPDQSFSYKVPYQAKPPILHTNSNIPLVQHIPTPVMHHHSKENINYQSRSTPVQHPLVQSKSSAQIPMSDLEEFDETLMNEMTNDESMLLTETININSSTHVLGNSLLSGVKQCALLQVSPAIKTPYIAPVMNGKSANVIAKEEVDL